MYGQIDFLNFKFVLRVNIDQQNYPLRFAMVYQIVFKLKLTKTLTSLRVLAKLPYLGIFFISDENAQYYLYNVCFSLCMLIVVICSSMYVCFLSA